MEVIKIIFIIVALGLITWLLVDTIIYVVKKIKAKKNRDHTEEQ